MKAASTYTTLNKFMEYASCQSTYREYNLEYGKTIFSAWTAGVVESVRFGVGLAFPGGVGALVRRLTPVSFSGSWIAALALLRSA